jgi:mono/diheme cytochrome c family protein
MCGQSWGVIVALLAALLLTRVQAPPGPLFNPRPLSAFDRAKAEWLLRNRLPCLGCHELGGEGGRIGPSLSELKRVRPPDYVYAMIRDPQGTVPGTLMPRVPMSQATLELIAGHLVQREPTRSSAPPVVPPAAGSEPAQPGTPAALYARSCAPCHGARGGGDGPNARFLPVRPTVHADSASMSTRSDDALFDAISAGGYVMNRSNRMPPFGETLTREQIWGLVRHLRKLCTCEGPAWSRDNR